MCCPGPGTSRAWSIRRGQANTSTGPTTISGTFRSRTGSRARRNTRARGGRTGASGSATSMPKRFRRARSARRPCRRSRMPPAATSRSAHSAKSLLYQGALLYKAPSSRRDGTYFSEGDGSMTRELFWLTLTVILTGLLWIPYIIDRSRVRGLSGAMANPSRNDKPHAEWATRLMFAHDNAVENLIIFAPLVLILNAIDYSSKWTVLACAVYFWARVAHLIVYTLGLPVFRTLAFTVGFLAQAVLALAIFKVV